MSVRLPSCAAWAMTTSSSFLVRILSCQFPWHLAEQTLRLHISQILIRCNLRTARSLYGNDIETIRDDMCDGALMRCAGGIQRYMDAFPDGGFFRGR